MTDEMKQLVREMQTTPGAAEIATRLARLARLVDSMDPVRARAFDDVATLLKHGRPYSPGTSVDW